MTGAAALALISILGLVAAVAAVGYVSLGIRRDDRQGILGGTAKLSTASRIARHVSGAHGLGARLW